MPKIIKDVEKTIRNCAAELFVQYSYSYVDMRMISKKSGVAVGTLYNYYGNKKQLYISIIKESWQNTFQKLDAVRDLAVSPEEKLSEFISTLYEDIEARSGLGKDLINTTETELIEDDEIKDLKNSLMLILSNFFNCLNKKENLNKCSNIDTRLEESLLICTLAMYELHPDDKKENISFLVKFIKLSIK
ncbi:MAG: transcriptional regulator, TetR family protein [Clostridiaceae bacterium]|jgi:AcrR family transcriptional regulator|nr:transcriptional regulator, TetR family protein [Clostridiaceae bacterium]